MFSKASWMMVRTGGHWIVSANLFVPGTDTRSVSLGHIAGCRSSSSKRSAAAPCPPGPPSCTVGRSATEDEVLRLALADSEAAVGKSCHDGLYKNKVKKKKEKKKRKTYLSDDRLQDVGGDTLSLSKPSGL